MLDSAFDLSGLDNIPEATKVRIHKWSRISNKIFILYGILINIGVAIVLNSPVKESSTPIEPHLWSKIIYVVYMSSLFLCFFCLFIIWGVTGTYVSIKYGFFKRQKYLRKDVLGKMVLYMFLIALAIQVIFKIAFLLFT